MKRSGAQLLLDVITNEGGEYIFGNPGTTELPLIDKLAENKHLKYILALQEASAVAMADGYAHASGKPGIVNLHTAGGLGHGMGNLLNALTSGTPLVVTAGQQDSRHAISDPLLQGDLLSIAKPACKWTAEISSPDQIPILVHRAFQDCQAPPRGPVFLSLPMDAMEALSEQAIQERSHVDRRPTASSIPELADELMKFNPGEIAIIAGDEIAYHDSYSEVVQLAEVLAAPVFGSSWPASIPFPTSHFLWRGNLPTTASGIAETIKDYQCIFALGGKSFITILYSNQSALPNNCQLFQLSVDGRDLGRTFSSKLSLVGDIQYSLKKLNPLLQKITEQKRSGYEKARSKEKETFSKKQMLLQNQSLQFEKQDVLHPIVAAKHLALAIGTVPIVDEAIATATYLRQFLNNHSVKQYIFIRGGALGWGMPAAVGYSLGLGKKPVTAIVGDGAALYSPQAMWTAAKENLPVTFIIINNQEYNVLKKYMRTQSHYVSNDKQNYIGMELNKPKIDYLALATSMGLSSQTLTTGAEILENIPKLVALGKPSLVEIKVAAE